MKKFIFILPVFLGLIAACVPEEKVTYEKNMTVTLKSASVYVAIGSQGTVEYTAENFKNMVNASIKGEVEHVKISNSFDVATGKGTLTVTTDRTEEDTEGKTVDINFTDGAAIVTKSLKVFSTVTEIKFWDGKDKEVLNLSPMHKEIGFLLAFEDINLIVDIPQDMAQWVSAAPYVDYEGKHRIKVSVKDYTTGTSPRHGVMSFKTATSSNSLTIEITQRGDLQEGSLRDALMAFYNATNGPAWTQQENWGSDKPLDQWYGLYVWGHRDMSENFEELWELRLPGVGSEGTIPDKFWDAFPNFTTVDLDGNRYESNVLPDKIWHDELKELDLRSTLVHWQMNGSIGNAKNLERLDLAWGRTSWERGNITGQIPEELCNLTKLRYIDLQRNQIVGTLPSNIGNMSCLQELKLLHNEIGGELPESFYSLDNLGRAVLSDNKFTGSISPKIGNMSNLVDIWISDCNFEGVLPEEFGLCKNLQVCYFEGNYFTKLPEFIRYMKDRWPFEWGDFADTQRKKETGARADFPITKWYFERYNSPQWGFSGNSDWPAEIMKVPEYPVADDLQYPADEYYYDAGLKVWTHPKYEGKAAKHYHKINDVWTYDESFDWTDPDWEHNWFNSSLSEHFDIDHFSIEIK